MSELLDRIQREIRERLEATRAAVLEHERLEAALHALGDAGARATRAVRGSGRGSGATESVRRAGAASKSSAARVRRKEQPAGAPGTAKSASPARAGGATAAGGRSARAKSQRVRASAKGRVSSAAGERAPAARGSAATPVRRRAPRGANREAVLRVVGERPGVTARELGAVSGVTGGTLYTLLRRLTDDGTLEKRELPGGQAGYALASSAAAAAGPAAPQPQTATAEAGPGVESRTAAKPENDSADRTDTSDAGRSALTEG